MAATATTVPPAVAARAICSGVNLPVSPKVFCKCLAQAGVLENEAQTGGDVEAEHGP